MLYQPSEQEQLKHNFYKDMPINHLNYHENNYNFTQLINSINSGGKVEKEFSEKISSEVLSNRLSANPYKNLHKEKANSEILLLTQNSENLTEEEKMKILEFKENHYPTFEKFNNTNLKSNMELIGSFSEYLYYFTLTNLKSSINEENSLQEAEIKLEEIRKSTLSNEKLLGNYNMISPILEKLMNFEEKNIDQKINYFDEMSLNVNEILKDSDLLYKINSDLNLIFKNFEKIIEEIQSQIYQNLSATKKEEFKENLKKSLNLLFKISYNFKSSFGFLLFAKFVQKFKLQNEIEIEADFREINKLPENAFFDKDENRFRKTWNISDLKINENFIFKKNDAESEENLGDTYAKNELFGFTEDTSISSFGNYLYLYNKIFGLIKLKYSEENNNLIFCDINPKAFGLRSGNIITQGNEEFCFIIFIKDNYFIEDFIINEENNESKKIQILFSEDINAINENKYSFKVEKKFEEIFQNLKNFFNNGFKSFNKDGNINDFLYTEKQIKIPKDDINSNNFNNEKEKLQNNYLKKIKIFFKNNLLYSFRPLLKQKTNKNNYFSNSEIYVVDIFTTNISNNNSEKINKTTHIKSIVIKSSEKNPNKEIEKNFNNFLDDLNPQNFNSITIQQGKLIILNASKFFIFDLIFEEFDFVEKIEFKKEEEKFHKENFFYFFSKNNCLVLLNHINEFKENLKKKNLLNAESYQQIKSKFSTFSIESYTNNYFFGEFDELFFYFFNENKKEENLQKKNLSKNLQIKKFINSDADKNKENKAEKNLENLEKSGKKNENFLVSFFMKLAFLANCKVNNRVNSVNSFKNLLKEDYLSYNNSNNFQLIFSNCQEIFEEIKLSKFDDANVNANEIKNNLVLMFSHLMILKLHVKNNSKMKLNIELYFNTQDEFERNLLNLFDYLQFFTTEITTRNSFVNKNKEEEENISLNNLLINNIKILWENISEFLAFSYTNKSKLVSYVEQFLIFFVKLKEKIFIKNQNEDTKTNTNSNFILDEIKSLIIKSLSNLFSQNSNFIFAFLLNENLRNFLKEIFQVELNSEKNKKNILSENILPENSQNFLMKILNEILVKIFHTNFSFGKNFDEATKEKIFLGIFENLEKEKLKEKEEEFTYTINSFLIFLISEFFEFANFSYEENKKIYENYFCNKGIFLILNYLNLLPFEKISEILFGNWFLVMNYLNKITSKKNEEKFLGKKPQVFNLEKEMKDDFNTEFIKERLELISEQRNLLDFSLNENENDFKKIDVIADNNLIDDKKQCNYKIKVKPEYLNLNKNSKKTEGFYNLYIMVNTFNNNKPDSLSKKLFSFESKKIKFEYKIKNGIKTEYFIVNKIPIDSDLEINFNNINLQNSEDSNILYKIRISNYKFFDENYNLTNSLKLYMNKFIHYLIFYENSKMPNLNIDEEIKELISTFLFSSQIKNHNLIDKANKDIDKDVQNFFNFLDKTHKEKFSFLQEEQNENNFNSNFNFSKIENEEISKSEKSENFLELFFKEISESKITFEELITLKDNDFGNFENLKFEEIPEKKEKIFFLFKKLFSIFDFLLEKYNREFLIKGNLSDKMIIGIFFTCVNNPDFLFPLQKTFEILFKNSNFDLLKENDLIKNKEEIFKFLNFKEIEEIFLIWKNAQNFRRIFKNKKNFIFQQLEDSESNKEILNEFYSKNSNLNFFVSKKYSENDDFTKILCNLDPKEKEEEIILNYFDLFFRKLKMIFYLKISENKKKKRKLRKTYLLKKTQNFKNEEIEKNFLKKKTSFMERKLRNFKEEDSNFSDKKIMKKLKENVSNIFEIVSNDEINPENIFICLDSLDVKVKFREIVLLIINIILKNFKDCETKSDLVSNFYYCFNTGNILPNVIDNLSIASTEQGEIINNLFHEYLYNITEEINGMFNLNDKSDINNDTNKKISYYKNSENSSVYYLSILLNNLFWNIKGRDMQFFIDAQFFQNLFNNQKNQILIKCKNRLFSEEILFNEKNQITNKIICAFNESHISFLLTEIIKTYSFLIQKRIIKESKIAEETPITNNSLTLKRTNSSIINVNHNDLIFSILDIYNETLENFLTEILQEKKSQFLQKNKNFNFYDFAIFSKLEFCYIYKDEDENSIFNNLIFHQKKIWNIFANLLRIIFIQNRSTDFVFNHITLFAKIFEYILYSNEKNTFLLFSIMKIFAKNFEKNFECFEYFITKIIKIYLDFLRKKNEKSQKNNLDLLINYTEKDIEEMDKVEFFMKFLLSMNYFISNTRQEKDSLVFDIEIFSIANNPENNILNSLEENVYDFLRFFINLENFREKCNFILKNILKENKLGFYLISKLLSSDVGYLRNFKKVICNTKLNFDKSLSIKNFTNCELDSMVKKGILIFNKDLYFHLESSSEYSKNYFSNINDNKKSENSVITFMEEESNKINQMEINSPNLLSPNLSEIFIDDENFDKSDFFVNNGTEIVKKILSFFKENLVNKNICSFNFLQTYIRISKYLKKILLFYFSNSQNFSENKTLVNNLKEIVNFILNFITENKKFLEFFLTFDTKNTVANLFNLDKLENLFFSYRTFDIKKLNKTKKEENLIFKNPLNNDKENLNKFPFGVKNLSNKKTQKKSEMKIPNKTEVENLKFFINFTERIGTFKMRENILEKIFFSDYVKSHDKKLFDKYDCQNIVLNLEIWGEEKAQKILEEKKKKKNVKAEEIVIFFTDEFLEKLNIHDELINYDLEEYKEELLKKDEGKDNLNQDGEDEGLNLGGLFGEEEQEENNVEEEEKAEDKDKEKEKEKAEDKAEDKEKENEDKDKDKENEDKDKENEDKDKENEDKDKNKEIRKVPLNQILLENYLNDNFISRKTMIILSDKYFHKLQKNYNCISLDYDLLSENFKSFLQSPKNILNNLDNKESFKTKKFLLKKLYTILNNQIIETENTNEENDEENLYTNYLKRLKIKPIFTEKPCDSNLENYKTFGILQNKIEIKPLKNQTEEEIKSLGFHILKQHLRFMFIFSIEKDLNLKKLKNFEIENLLKYLKLLYFQSNFKAKFFNLKVENEFLKKIIISIIDFTIKSNSTKSLIINSKENKLISFQDDFCNENNLSNSDFLFFFNEIIENLNLSLIFLGNNSEIIRNQIENNIISILQILSNLLYRFIKAESHYKILNILQIYSKFLNNFTSLLENSTKNKEKTKQISNLISFTKRIKDFFLNQNTFKILCVESKIEGLFNNQIFEFSVKVIKFIDYSQEICKENFLSDIVKFAGWTFKIYKDLELLKNKTNSKWLLNYLAENSNLYKDFLTKKIKLPNLKNFYYLVANKENTFSSYFSYKESLKENKFFVNFRNLSCSKDENSKEKENELTFCNKDLNNFESKYFSEKNIFVEKKTKEKIIEKILIFPERNYYSQNEIKLISVKRYSDQKQKIFELSEKVNKIYSLPLNCGLIYEAEGKYFIKGYYGKTVKSASVLQEIEFILRTEKLIKFFDSGILITEKNVYSIGEYHEKINGEQKYKSFSYGKYTGPPEDIKFAKRGNNVIGFVTENNEIYYAGYELMDNNYEETEMDLNEFRKWESNLPNGSDIIDMKAGHQCLVFLVKDSDGINTIWGLGENSNYLCINSSNYRMSGEISSWKHTPIKKFVIPNDKLFIALDDQNKIYYSGKIKSDNKYKTSWKLNNKFNIIDLLDAGGDTVIIKAQKIDTNEIKFLIMGDTSLFSKDMNYINFCDGTPLEIDTNDIFNYLKEDKKCEISEKQEEIENFSKEKNEFFDFEFEEDEIDQLEHLQIGKFALEKDSENLFENEEIIFEDFQKEFNMENFFIKDIKCCQNPNLDFTFSYITGFKNFERNLDLEFLKKKMEDEYNLIFNNKEKNSEEFENNFYFIVVKNENDFSSKITFNKFSEFIYIALSVRKSGDLIIISSKIFVKSNDLKNEAKLNKIEISEENIKAIKEKLSKNDTNEFGNLLKFDFIKTNIENNLEISEYIKANFTELSDCLFLSEEIVVDLSLKNEYYLNKENQQNIILEQIPDNKDIKLNFSSVFSEIENTIKEKYLSNLKINLIKEYQKAKDDHENEINEKTTFEKYLQKNYKNNKSYTCFFEKSYQEIIELISIKLNDSFNLLIDQINPKIKNEIFYIFVENIELLSRNKKHKLIQKELTALKESPSAKTISIDRFYARRFRNQIDKKFEWTIFSQAYKIMNDWIPEYFIKKKDNFLFEVSLKNEGAIDAGGPRREVFTNIFEDLLSNRLDLFIPTPNNRTNSGLGRDMWTVNPSAKTIHHLDCLKFLGKLFGFSIFSLVYCPMKLPNFLWKQILGIKLKPEDISEIDFLAYNSIVKICLNPIEYKSELDNFFEFAKFSAYLSNGEEVNLIPDGSEISVNENNYKEFINLYINARFMEIKEQADAIASGINFIIPEKAMILMGPDYLNESITGPKEFNLDLLKKCTKYERFKPTDKVIQFFWRFLEEATLEEKIQYLKFCWGRTTLPNSVATFTNKHQINNTNLKPDFMPVGHTCFFSIDLPLYETYEDLCVKMRYAINNAVIINDGDDTNLNIIDD